MSFLKEDQKKMLRNMRKSLDNFVIKIADKPTEINDNMMVIRKWHAGTDKTPITYTANVDVRLYAGVPYTCSQTHTHHGESGWEPGPESALWKETHGTTPETARPFVTRGDNPYMINEYCVDDDVIYKCVMDNCTWSPSVYPQAWAAIN